MVLACDTLLATQVTVPADLLVLKNETRYAAAVKAVLYKAECKSEDSATGAGTRVLFRHNGCSNQHHQLIAKVDAPTMLLPCLVVAIVFSTNYRLAFFVLFDHCTPFLC